MLSEKDTSLIKSILGDDIFQELEKSEVGGGLYKKNTKTALDPGEIKVALEIVPRTILSFLMANLKHKEAGEVCKIDLPFAPGAVLECHKLGADNYSGEIVKEGARCVEFLHRSLPGIGLIILTTFELYDLSDMRTNNSAPENHDKTEKLQEIIDQRLELHRLVRDVVDKRISERAAIDMLIRERLSSHIVSVQIDNEKDEAPMDKKSKLRQFLENREKKRQEPVEMDKSDINCPDCGNTLFKNENDKQIKLCICYGDNMNKTIKFTKAEGGKVNLKFPKSFDIDNIEMLLDALKKQ